MLKIGEKGAIPQRQEGVYAIAPHIPCGLVTPELLRRIADVAEKYEVKAVKITGATRVTLVGLSEEQIDPAWADLKLDKGAAVGLCVRSVRACPGNTFCKLGKQDALKMGMELDGKYHGLELPGKFKMAVSGCNLNCAEGWVRDVGLYGMKDGWTVTIGGNVGSVPRIGRELTKGLDDQEALRAVDQVIACYREQAKKGERLGKTIERVGMDPFVAAVS